ncbi:hypothetical protein QUF90_15240 [Desulfococcaceae bacterium HSG9]|nr:hypothetical protein [Desulfococcaceae bacterium HSG9]
MNLNWLLAMTPIVGLTVNTITHALFSRILNKSSVSISIILAFICHIVCTVSISVLVLNSMSLMKGDFWALLGFNLIISLALAYGYFNFINLNIASIRIRLLKEILISDKGLMLDDILTIYNPDKIVNTRIERLISGGQLVSKNGRCVVGAPFILLLANIMEVLKHIIMGQGSRLGKEKQ